MYNEHDLKMKVNKVPPTNILCKVNARAACNAAGSSWLSSRVHITKYPV